LIKKLPIIFLVLFIGLSGYLGYRLFALDKAHTLLEKNLAQTQHKVQLLQKKYAEQKAQVATLQRAKLMVEGLKRQAELKAEELAKQVEQQKTQLAAMEKKVGANVQALEARLADKDRKINQWKEQYGKLKDAFQLAKKTIAERDASIAKLEESNSELESELQFTQRTRDRYRNNNHEMASTAQSILARYDEDGVFGKTLLEVEPFTQIKKVELEKLIQEYLDQIDDQVIRERE
jgi:chromosome segregation ATPase